ncbi:hypothetical protein [Salibacterium halotolerans]|uniref:Uncharacterized protein n=1 Tax=Salibacterium halotolerans TaxID=1884432 RepID=A0A1I5YAF1_9BACI|nr:hypothetical protein [Salibacterium halotolerans]SFQ41195.1 hypothetical protein SAMN05518683_1392 [Salibacterium halotolerans]
MLVKILNVCVVLFIGMVFIPFLMAGFTPGVAEDFFTISWLSVSLRILLFIVGIGSITNFVHKYFEEDQVRLVHFQMGLMITIVGLLFYEWKNDWPIIRSFF